MLISEHIVGLQKILEEKDAGKKEVKGPKDEGPKK